MADYRAISGVSSTLRDLLADRIELPPSVVPTAFEVTVGLPRSDAGTPQAVETPRVNLFLYRLTENAALKNQMPPAAGPPVAYGHPPLALDLHYLVTAFGSSAEEQAVPSDLTAQLLLAGAMRVLHDHAVVTERLMSVAEALPRPLLHESLRDDYENLRIVLEPLSLEDSSKLWTALTLPLRLSAAYHVTAVQIESRRRRGFPLPVGELPAAGPRVLAAPLRVPVIGEVGLRDGSADRRRAYLRVGDLMVLWGRGFGRDPLRVLLGEVEVTATPTDDERVEFVVPDDPALQPGLQSVQVAIRFGPTAAMTARSNTAAFMLVPRVQTMAVAGRVLTIGGARLSVPDRAGETLIGRAMVERRDYLSATATSLQVPLPDTLPVAAAPGVLSAVVALPAPSGELALRYGPAGTPLLANVTEQATRLPDAALLLQAALRDVARRHPELPAAEAAAYRQARVGVAGGRLVVLAGGLAQAFVFANAGADPLATTLGLTGGTRTMRLSGALQPFVPLSAAAPALRLVVNGGVPVDVPLLPTPTTLDTAATAVATALASVPALAGASVGTLEQQLLVVLPPATTLVVGFVPSGDLTTARELHLAALYPLRVRANGAESIDWFEVPLP